MLLQVNILVTILVITQGIGSLSVGDVKSTFFGSATRSASTICCFSEVDCILYTLYNLVCPPEPVPNPDAPCPAVCNRGCANGVCQVYNPTNGTCDILDKQILQMSHRLVDLKRLSLCLTQCRLVSSVQALTLAFPHAFWSILFAPRMPVAIFLC
jgi:hypothetical protein